MDQLNRELLKKYKEHVQANMQGLLTDYIQITGTLSETKMNHQDWILFSCFALCTLIKLKTDHFMNINEESFNESMVETIKNNLLESPNLKQIINYLKIVGIEQQFNQNNKDRKNSFIRLIIRHLKKLKDSNISEEKKSIIKQVQLKLNQNTISGQKIDQLFSQWQQNILEFLKNKFLKDVLTINKSRVNKCFYLLHYYQIMDYIQNRKISSFKFYQKLTIEQALGKIIKSHYNSYYDNVENNQKKKNQSIFYQKMNMNIHQTPELERVILVEIPTFEEQKWSQGNEFFPYEYFQPGEDQNFDSHQIQTDVEYQFSHRNY